MHALYFYWMSRAFEHGDLSLVYPIARSTPAFLPLVAAPLLGERFIRVACWASRWSSPGSGSVRGPAQRWQSFATPATRFAFLTLAATVAYSLFDKRRCGSSVRTTGRARCRARWSTRC